MKVIHFVAAIDCSLGGVSTYMQLLTKELGQLTELIIVTWPTKSPLPLVNCKVVYLPLFLSQTPKYLLQWRRLLLDFQPDIVHINGIWMLQTWLFQREAIKQGIPTFITLHGMLEPWILQRNRCKKRLALFLYQREAIRKANILITTAESEKQHVLELGYNSSVVFIPNGIDVSKIPIKKDWEIKKKILYLSRVHEKKGIELLLKVAFSLRNDLQDYEIIIAGEGEQEYIQGLKQQIKQMGIENIVNFVGGVYGDKKWELYSESDFFVLPTFSENFGYVIAEALACGVPVITTKGAPWEELDTYHCGCWIDRSHIALMEAMLSLIGKSSFQLKEMGLNGRKLVEQKYSASIMANLLYEQYNLLHKSR